MRTVPFYRHGLDETYAEAVAEVLRSPFLTTGGVAKAVEAQLCAFFDAPHAALVNSWTNGAVAVLLALGIGPGDEVVVPAMTFVATANVVELLGAKAIFVDVDPATLMLTPQAVAAALTRNTRVVMPVHIYGQMCDIAGLRRALAPRADIAIIEDCAHSFESTFNGDPPGRHSDAAIFSFYATKNVTCGEGGAVVTRRPELFDTLLQTRLHGMSAGAIDRFEKNRYRHWDVARLGTKANLPDLLAALLPRQIATIRQRLPRRQALARRYEEALGGGPIRLVKAMRGAVHAHHLFPIHVPARLRDRTLAALNERGVGTTVNYRAVPSLTYYREKYGYTAADFPVAWEWGEGTISLPLYPSMSPADQDYVIETVRELVAPAVGA